MSLCASIRGEVKRGYSHDDGDTCCLHHTGLFACQIRMQCLLLDEFTKTDDYTCLYMGSFFVLIVRDDVHVPA